MVTVGLRRSVQPAGPGLATDPTYTGPPSAPTARVGRGAQPLQAAGSAHSTQAQAFPTAPWEGWGVSTKDMGAPTGIA